ncbi:hypothetical protein BZG36_04105 [Bifiguratus adelaidae]|uniref:Uncharacterized protein n=1 Tax=Bifiguratus adelaidae TaxID=1938954 RepID=A0A261XVX2_9FUNG|nr:hypothetical protein BZG36_04105 [Bifiguratus adelaidae]
MSSVPPGSLAQNVYQQQQNMSGQAGNVYGPTDAKLPYGNEHGQPGMEPAKAPYDGGYPGGVPPSQQGTPVFVQERLRIEQSLGPVCPKGGYHELRMHYTTTTLLFAWLVIPYLCGWRGKRECVCKKCGQKFPQIYLPEP